MKFKVTRPVIGGTVYLVEADSRDTVEALFTLYDAPEEFCPGVKVLTDEVDDSGEIIIEEWEDDFYQEVD